MVLTSIMCQMLMGLQSRKKLSQYIRDIAAQLNLQIELIFLCELEVQLPDNINKTELNGPMVRLSTQQESPKKRLN